MKSKIVLLLIVFLAVGVRFWKLGDYPALNADEASIGYDAYSLLTTGKDQHGNSWPVSFQSFNDYKPGLYIYLAVPSVALFGLNEWSVRVPGALAGVGTVLILYLLVIELGRYHSPTTSHKLLATTAMFLLAISPWHIHFSRGGWEVNVATFFIVLGIFFFLKSHAKSWYLVLSCVSFVLALYTYHAARVIVPLLVLGLAVLYFGKLRKIKKLVVIAITVSVVVSLPLIHDLLGPAGFSRANGVGLFADQGTVSRIQEQRGEHTSQELLAKAFHNKFVNYALAFAQNLGKHFWGEFLFLSGDDIQRNRVPETGQLYLFQFPLLLIGLWHILKNRNKPLVFIVFWLVVSPVASSLTFQSPHALRAQIMVIPLTIVSAYGLVEIVKWLNNLKLQNKLLFIVYCSLFIAVTWEFLRYQHMYWVHMAREYPYSSQYGVKDLVNYLRGESAKYDRIIVTDRYDQPYILFLFYGVSLGEEKYLPAKFQSDHVLTSPDGFGFSTVRTFANFNFESIEFTKMESSYTNSLIIGTENEIPGDANIVKDIYGSNGHLYFRVVEN